MIAATIAKPANVMKIQTESVAKVSLEFVPV
jgi:hypothetical protein